MLSSSFFKHHTMLTTLHTVTHCYIYMHIYMHINSPFFLINFKVWWPLSLSSSLFKHRTMQNDVTRRHTSCVIPPFQHSMLLFFLCACSAQTMRQWGGWGLVKANEFVSQSLYEALTSYPGCGGLGVQEFQLKPKGCNSHFLDTLVDPKFLHLNKDYT